jgi:BMFP domain-containing protein YqiC
MSNSSASKAITKEEMAELLRQMNFATKDDLEDLRQRISALEAKNQNV